MALVLSIAYLKVFLIAYLPIHGLNIFEFLFFYKFIIYDCFYVHCSSTHALQINLILSNLEGFVL
jgi:hypothetical protein